VLLGNFCFGDQRIISNVYIRNKTPKSTVLPQAEDKRSIRFPWPKLEAALSTINEIVIDTEQ